MSGKRIHDSGAAASLEPSDYSCHFLYKYDDYGAKRDLRISSPSTVAKTCLGIKQLAAERIEVLIPRASEQDGVDVGKFVDLARDAGGRESL